MISANKTKRINPTNLLMLTLAGILTRVDGRGGFSNTFRSMVYFVVNRFQVTKMKDIVHGIDPFAYIIISEVADVFSRNLKLK